MKLSVQQVGVGWILSIVPLCLHAIVFASLVHAGVTKLFSYEFVSHFPFLSFSVALLCTSILSPIRMPFGTLFPCLQAQQVGIGWITLRGSCVCCLAQVWSMLG